MSAYGMKFVSQVNAKSRSESAPYYCEMKRLAREVRGHYALASPCVGCMELRRIYRELGIRLTAWPGKVRSIRGAYFNDGLGVDVMVMKGLSEDAMAFTMAHELKHHFVDSDLRPFSRWQLDRKNPIEVGADVFAAELIYPEKDFQSDLGTLRLRKKKCFVKVLLQLKAKTGTTLPHWVMRDRAVRMGIAPASAFCSRSWKKLEQETW